jgi:hypothetical protein
MKKTIPYLLQEDVHAVLTDNIGELAEYVGKGS